MKYLIMTAFIALSSSSLFAKQEENSPAQRVVSQEDGVTASDTSNKPIDIAAAREIRRELMRDDSLSTKAKNVKIIVLNNGITLKGSVHNDAEMEKVLKHAYVGAPKYKIYNQISIVK
jgi:hypothetical protein